ncbi:hypothetical protein B0O80DRAFT_46475 [Mortierella sp. GBAus27b]|nr:hypothetical protein B0O80DRAFT_46475 [Mortierella sp. GBAus27b]
MRLGHVSRKPPSFRAQPPRSPRLFHSNSFPADSRDDWTLDILNNASIQDRRHSSIFFRHALSVQRARVLCFVLLQLRTLPQLRNLLVVRCSTRSVPRSLRRAKSNLVLYYHALRASSSLFATYWYHPRSHSIEQPHSRKLTTWRAWRPNRGFVLFPILFLIPLVFRATATSIDDPYPDLLKEFLRRFFYVISKHGELKPTRL